MTASPRPLNTRRPFNTGVANTEIVREKTRDLFENWPLNTGQLYTAFETWSHVNIIALVLFEKTFV